MEKLDKKETARLNKNFNRKEIKKAKKQQTIFADALSKISFDVCDNVKEYIDNPKNNSSFLIDNIDSPKQKEKPYQMRNNLKSFAQTFYRFNLLNKVAATLFSSLFRNFEFVSPSKNKVHRQSFKR